MKVAVLFATLAAVFVAAAPARKSPSHIRSRSLPLRSGVAVILSLSPSPNAAQEAATPTDAAAVESIVNEELAAISSLFDAFPASEPPWPVPCIPGRGGLTEPFWTCPPRLAVETIIADVFNGQVSEAEVLASSLGADPAFQSAILAE